LGSQKLGSQKLGSQKLGSQKLGSRKLGSQKLGSRKLGSQKLGSQKLGSQKLEPRCLHLIWFELQSQLNKRNNCRFNQLLYWYAGWPVKIQQKCVLNSHNVIRMIFVPTVHNVGGQCLNDVKWHRGLNSGVEKLYPSFQQNPFYYNKKCSPVGSGNFRPPSFSGMQQDTQCITSTDETLKPGC